MFIVYACKDWKDIEIARYSDKKKAEEFKASVEDCEKLSGYVVIIKEC